MSDMHTNWYTCYSDIAGGINGALFKKKFPNLNYNAKLPDWPVTGCHGNEIKNPATLIPPEYNHLPPP